MKIREIVHTSIEGTNPAPASHSQHAASQTRKRPQCALFRVSNRIGNGQLVEDLALPSAAPTTVAGATHTRGQVCQGAADRSLCMEWTPCMLKQCTRPPSLAPMHESPCFTYSPRCARLVLAGAEKWQLVVIFRRSHQLQLIVPGSSARWPSGCSLFHAEAACVSRERLVRCRPLSACAARTGRGRCLRRS